MTYQLFDMIGEALITLFGGSMLLPLVIIGVIAALILSIKGGKFLLVLILLPLVVIAFSGGALSGALAGLTLPMIPIALAMFLILGVFMAMVIWKIIQ